MQNIFKFVEITEQKIKESKSVLLQNAFRPPKSAYTDN